MTGRSSRSTCGSTYYIDYGTSPVHQTFLNHLANWDFALENFKKAEARQPARSS